MLLEVETRLMTYFLYVQKICWQGFDLGMTRGTSNSLIMHG